MTAADLTAAQAALDAAQAVIDAASRRLTRDTVKQQQAVAYDMAHAAAAVMAGRAMLDYGAHGELEARMACAFVADAVADLASKLFGREALWGVSNDALDGVRKFTTTYRDPEFVAALAMDDGPRHLDSDLELVQDTFRKFAEEKVKPVAERIHRENADIPEDLIEGLAELGTFGLSIPEQYEGFSMGGESEYMGMVVATEELSRGSLGAGGSLITRPEILVRILMAGGTEEQKRSWLPRIASGEILNAVAVTEPNGSDVAAVRVSATRTEDGSGFLIKGVKTWCTFAARADVLSLLAVTDPSGKKRQNLSVFIVPKPRGDAHGFELTQQAGNGVPGGGRMEGRPIDTIGYRGMHSYEISFEDWYVPKENLIGGEAGEGRGFQYQGAGFVNGRLQTAARALGVMQAALEAARSYALDRIVGPGPVADFQLTRVKLARMAFLIQAGRQASYQAARLIANGDGVLESNMVKAYLCKAAEWVTREAMQIHGGFGYAEEYPVSRYFVDARVLSIFEGADETLCLMVVAPRLVKGAS